MELSQKDKKELRREARGAGKKTNIESLDGEEQEASTEKQSSGKKSWVSQ